MTNKPLFFSIAFLLLASSALPVVASDNKSGNDATKAATSRYKADKKLCAEESTSSARMQCLRDAKEEYNKAIDAAKKTQAADSKSSQGRSACADCGKVVDVTTSEKKGEGGALGMIGGGVAGALLGRQVGGGTGKDLATIAGAAGGAYAGHKIEEKMKTAKVWLVKVHLDSGEERSFEFDHDPGFAAGNLIKLSGATIVRR